MVPLPQFTERESKIMGPFTFKQFISLLIILGISGFIYINLPRSVSLPLAITIFIVGSVVCLVEIENEPLYSLILKRGKFIFLPKTYFWRKGDVRRPTFAEIEIKKIEGKKVKIKRESNLKNMLIKLSTKK